MSTSKKRQPKAEGEKAHLCLKKRGRPASSYIDDLAAPPDLKKGRWFWSKKRRMPTAPALKLTRAEKKAKKDEEVRKTNETPQQKLDDLKKKIKDIESQIQQRAAEFEIVRAEWLSGIISHNGVSAKNATDNLLHTLGKLKSNYAETLSQLDKAAIDKIKDMTSIQTNVAAAVSTNLGEDCRCLGGCKQEDLRADDSCCVEICVKCHATYDKRLDNKVGNMSYSDFHPGESCTRIGGGYKPPNHLAEIVAQFQGKRRAAAPQEIVDKVGDMCKRYRVPKHKIKPATCRMFLKQMQQEQAMVRKFNKKTAPAKYKKFTDYYKHSTEISFRLSGIPPPYMTPMQENRVFALFPLVVMAYKTSPRYLARKKDRKNRKTREEPNNMNYHYVFYKLCEMLGYEELLPYIPLPKSIANIDDNDYNGWKHCCEKYNWSFTSTR
jgi:hypothetical protein